MGTRYTARETAARLGLSYSYFMRLLWEGRFQHHRLGERIIFFTEEDIEAIMDSCKVEARAAVQSEREN